MHLYLQLTRSLTVTLIWFYCNKLVLRYVRLRVSDPGQDSIPHPGIVTLIIMFGTYNFMTPTTNSTVPKSYWHVGI